MLIGKGADVTRRMLWPDAVDDRRGERQYGGSKVLLPRGADVKLVSNAESEMV